MFTRLLRRTTSKSRTPEARMSEHYPYDPAHPAAPYAQTQRDVGASLLLGAVVVAVLMVLIIIGLA